MHADLLSGKKAGIFQYNQKLNVNLKAANGVVRSVAEPSDSLWLRMHVLSAERRKALPVTSVRAPYRRNSSCVQSVAVKAIRSPVGGRGLDTEFKGTWTNGLVTIETLPAVPKVRKPDSNWGMHF